jgi:integrase
MALSVFVPELAAEKDTVRVIVRSYLDTKEAQAKRGEFCARNFVEISRLLQLFADAEICDACDRVVDLATKACPRCGKDAPVALLGEREPATCLPGQLRDWIDAHTEWASAWTRRRTLRTVQACFNWAAGPLDKLIVANPFAGVKLPPGGRNRPMRLDEYRAILRRSPALFRRVLLFQRLVGTRPHEMSELEWEHVAIENGVAVLHRHKTAHSRRDHGPRVLTLHPIAVRLLVWLRRHNPTGSKRIFLNSRGTPWSRTTLSHRLSELRRRAGVSEDCKLYGLRHAYGTAAARRGVPMPLLMELMGHTSLATTMIYVHLAGERDDLKQAVERIFPKGK